MSFLPWVVLALAAIGIVVVDDSQTASTGIGTVAKVDRPYRASPWPTPNRMPRLEKSPDSKVALRDRLVHAGFYRESFLPLLQILRIALLALVVLGGYLLSLLDLFRSSRASRWDFWEPDLPR